MELSDELHVLPRDSVRYALTDDSQGLKVDEEGYFSRPVSSVMLIIVMVSKNREPGQRVMATFKW